MSVPLKTLADTLVPRFNLSRFGIATEEVLGYLVPLVGAENWAADAVRTNLKSLTGHFMNGVDRSFLALRCLTFCAHALSHSLSGWGRQSQDMTLGGLETTCRYILSARANTLDSQTSYRNARDGFQSAFDEIMKEQGPDSATRLESTPHDQYLSNVKFEQTSIGTIGPDVIRLIEEAEKLSQDLCIWLSELYTVLQNFLQDETASLDIPLTRIPFIPHDWEARLKALLKHLSDADAELVWVQGQYETWFNITKANVRDHLAKDFEARGDIIRLPPSKVKITVDSVPDSPSDEARIEIPTVVPEAPEAPEAPAVVLPKTILAESFTDTSRAQCEMTFDKIDQTQAGKSSLTFNFALHPKGSKPRYSKIVIGCRVRPLTSPEPSRSASTSTICLTDHHPKTPEDLEPSRTAEKWQPYLKCLHSSSGVEWTFYQNEWSLFNSSEPFAIPLTLDIDHGVEISLDVHVKIVRRRYLFGNQVDECKGQVDVPSSECVKS